MSDKITIIICFTRKKPLFDIGEVFITVEAKTILNALKIKPQELIMRHVLGDYGEVPHDDIAENNDAVKHGGEILSQYHFEKSQVWVKTESKLPRTTICLPSEYDSLGDV